MRKLRITVTVVFVLSLAAFLIYNTVTRLTADHTPPVIQCEEDTIAVSVSDGEEALMQGVTAADDRDGDLTDSVRISSMSNFTEPGKRTVEYVVFDSSNQAATCSRTVEYTDYTSPEIHLSEPLRFKLSEMAEADLTENMSVQDCLDGDITQQIRATYNDSMYVSAAGDYKITAQVSNSAGDTCSVPLTVTVTDSSEEKEEDKYYPVLSGYIIYTGAGQSVNLRELVTGLEHNGTVYSFTDDADVLPGTREDIQISDTVDFSSAGTYTVDFSFTSEGGAAAVTRLAVVVR